jgi:hypothetical protein
VELTSITIYPRGDIHREHRGIIWKLWRVKGARKTSPHDRIHYQVSGWRGRQALQLFGIDERDSHAKVAKVSPHTPAIVAVVATTRYDQYAATVAATQEGDRCLGKCKPNTINHLTGLASSSQFTIIIRDFCNRDYRIHDNDLQNRHRP